MYTDWFKLRKLPFRLRPDPEFLYLCNETRTVYEALRAAVAGGQKLVLLLGEAGVGKTTLLHALARDCQGSAILARVQQPKLTSQELAASLAEQFKLPTQDVTTHALRARLSQFVATESARGHSVVILVDEAHRCSSAMLTEFLNLTARPAAPLIIMAGEEQLSQSLSALQASDTAPLTPATLRLARLSQAQVGDYLKHRLEIAGSEGRELFEPDTIGEIVRYTGGTPQLINTLCDTALMIAQAHSVTRVGIIEIRDAARELNWIEFSARKPVTPALTDKDTPAPPAGTPRLPILALEVRHDTQLVGLVKLVPGRLVVGRGTAVGLHLDSRFVSRRHCQFVTTPEQTLVEDLGSANGIRVNDQRCSVQRVVAGDTITLGDYTLTCIETTPAPIV